MLKLMRAPHKYVQGENALNEFYDIVKDMGTSFLFICSKSGEKECRPKIEKSCAGTRGGTPNLEHSHMSVQLEVRGLVTQGEIIL